MIIVGELINASRKSVGKAITNQDSDFIKKLAIDQTEANATYIDVNAGIFVGQESDYIEWIIKNVQEVTKLPCCIDSPDPKVIERGIEIHKGKTPMINSISLEEGRFNEMIPLLRGTDLKVVALCMDDEKMPQTKDERMKIADVLINKLVQNNVKLENIYMDPLVQPISTDSSYGVEFLDTVEEIMTKYKGIHTMCGLSNISFGLPERKHINRQFAAMAIAKGLDGLIVDPLDKKMMTTIITAEMLAGRDSFCMKFLKSYRKKVIEI